MLQRLFVLRFHFTEVFEDSCRQPAKTHNWTKETGVHKQEEEYIVGKLISSSLCLRSPYPRSPFEIVALPEFFWVYSSLRGQTMPPISSDTFAFSVNSPFMVLVFYQVMSAMGRGLNYSNYISSCVILCRSNIGLLRLAWPVLSISCWHANVWSGCSSFGILQLKNVFDQKRLLACYLLLLTCQYLLRQLILWYLQIHLLSISLTKIHTSPFAPVYSIQYIVYSI